MTYIALYKFRRPYMIVALGNLRILSSISRTSIANYLLDVSFSYPVSLVRNSASKICNKKFLCSPFPTELSKRTQHIFFAVLCSPVTLYVHLLMSSNVTLDVTGPCGFPSPGAVTSPGLEASPGAGCPSEAGVGGWIKSCR